MVIQSGKRKRGGGEFLFIYLTNKNSNFCNKEKEENLPRE